MKNNFVSVLDFGSSKITCMIATPMDHGDFLIKAVGQCYYNGFDETNWYEPEKLTDCIRQAVSQAESKVGFKVRNIYVGVPGAFCTLLTSESSLAFQSRKKIDTADLEELAAKANIFEDYSEGIFVGSNAVYYLMDGAIQVENPVGSVVNKISGLFSFSFMSKGFARSVRESLNAIGINKVTFLNACECQAKYISAMYNKPSYAIIIDIGDITSSVMLSVGDGLVFARTFALGSGYLASDISTVFSCDFTMAKRLLPEINLNLEFQAGDTYNVGSFAVDAGQTNEVVKARIEQIAEYIKRCFDYCDREIPRSTQIYLTGGGLTYLRGGSDCLSAFLGKHIIKYDSANPQTRRNEYTSCYGLIMQALKETPSKPNSILSFFKKLGGK